MSNYVSVLRHAFLNKNVRIPYFDIHYSIFYIRYIHILRKSDIKYRAPNAQYPMRLLPPESIL
jgi:hypothetical protein